jgi:hypothetical protein
MVSPLLLLPFLGCADVHGVHNDSSSVDVDATAGLLVDTSRWDAPTLDGGGVDSSLDAPIVPDAWLPAELCNGVDEDDDSLVDEGAQADCRIAPGAGEAVCVGGACRCREEGALAHAGAFADCNADWRDGCETALDSPANCGGCGVVCDAVSECTDTEVGGLRCRPMGILDFSLSRRDGEISCVVGLDHRVLCRGPNAAHAISDAAEESATLDWTVLDVPASNGVRADLHVRADGTEVMTVCVITTEGDVVCRGGNDTGLLGYGDREPRAGNHRIALPEAVYRLEIRQGDAYAMFGTDASGVTLWRWGGGSATAPLRWLQGEVGHFAFGNMPIASHAYPDPTAPPWEPMRMIGEVVAWGPHHDRLANRDDTEPPWTEPTRIIRTTLPVACARDVCCLVIADQFLGCWGPPTPWLESPPQPIGAYASIRAGAAEDPVHVLQFVSGPPDFPVRHEIRMAPTPGGGSDVCVGRAMSADAAATFRAAGALPSLWCADARRLAELPNTVLDERLRPEPDRYSEDGRPARSRPDWDAMCLDLAPNHWRCWGLHEGWGHPPIP